MRCIASLRVIIFRCFLFQILRSRDLTCNVPALFQIFTPMLVFGYASENKMRTDFAKRLTKLSSGFLRYSSTPPQPLRAGRMQVQTGDFLLLKQHP